MSIALYGKQISSIASAFSKYPDNLTKEFVLNLKRLESLDSRFSLEVGAGSCVFEPDS